MAITASRKARRTNRFARGSAAAFALGLFLAGPQAATPVAGADTGDDTASAPADTEAGPVAGKASATRGAGRAVAAADTAGPRNAPGRSAGAGGTRAPSPAAARTARAAAAVAAPKSSARPADSQTELAVAAPAVAADPDTVTPEAPETVETTVAVTEYDPPAVTSTPIPVFYAASPAVVPVAAPAPVSAVSAVQGAVDNFFHSLADALAGLPESGFTTTLEGALLLVRRSLFNQAPVATPVQTAVTETGQILGDIGGRDPDGDAVTYSVVSGPQSGTVEVGADGSYLYTPGDGYTGSDSFTVRIDGDASGFNILSPGGHAATDVQVLVGAGAASNPFTGSGAHQDPVDATLHLSDAAAQIAVAKTQGRFTATVALTDVTPDTQLMWMDATGRRGQVSVDEMVSTHWAEYAAAAEAGGGGVTLGLVYAAENGTQHAVVLTDVHATQSADGQIVFTGDLAPDAEAKTGYADDFWDVIGVGFKGDYENFRREYVEVANFTPVSFAVSGADLYTDTYSLSEYKTRMAADDGVRLTDAAGNPIASASTPAAGQWPSGNLAQPDGRLLQLTQSIVATLPDVNGVIVGLADGSVRQWDGIGWKQLRAPGAGTVKALFALPGGTAAVVQQDQQVTVSQFDGSTWKYLAGTGLSWASTNADLQLSGLNAIQTPSGYILGMVVESQCLTTCDSDKANPYTYVQLYQGGTSTNAPAVKGARMVSATSYNNGVVASFDDGTVQRFDGSGWSTLLDDSGVFSNTITTAVATYQDGIVITQDDGSVRTWTPAGGWVDNIGGYQKVEAYNQATAVTAFGDEIFVGYDNGDLIQFSPEVKYSDEYPGYRSYPIPDAKTAEQLSLSVRYDGYGSGKVTSIVSYGPGAVVTWANGVVAQYDFSTRTWSSMKVAADGEAVSATIKDGSNLLLSVNTDGSLGHVSQWTPGGSQFLELGGANDLALSPETLKAAIQYVQNGGTATSAGDPIFGLAQNQAACEGLGTCTGTYQFFRFATDPKVPYGVPLKTYYFGAKESTTANPPSLGLRYDVGVSSYGYLFIPSGTWQQTDPKYYSLGFFLAKTTGPSLNLNLPLNDEADGKFSLDVASTALDEVSVEVPTPYGVFGVEGNVSVGIRATLDLPKGFSDQPWYAQKLTVSYYDTQGSLYTYNTAGREGFGKSDNELPRDLVFPDIENLTLGPTINPSINLAWGLYKNFPVIGELSFLKVALGYENPVTLNFGPNEKGDFTVTGSVAGNFTAEAGVLGSFVNFLTWKYSKAIYKDTVDLGTLGTANPGV